MKISKKNEFWKLSQNLVKKELVQIIQQLHQFNTNGNIVNNLFSNF